jgi:hypothetical protein
MRYLISALAMMMASFTYADSSREVKLLVEKTFARDNTFCHFKNKTLEISVRAVDRSSEKKESIYGQHIFQVDKGNYSLLPVNKEKFGRYKLYRGQSKVCSKSLGVNLDKETSAILFLKANHPFKDKLVIQLYDSQLATPKDAIETDYLTDKIILSENGFQFRSLTERIDRQIGKVNIGGNDYIFQDQDMAPWMSYNIKGFEILPLETFNNSPWKSFFTNESDFYMFSGWNPEEKKFTNPFVYTAINHSLKRQCILFSSGPQQKLSGNEFWRCKDN